MLIENKAPRIFMAPIAKRVALYPGITSVSSTDGEQIVSHKWFKENPHLSVSGDIKPASKKSDEQKDEGGNFEEIKDMKVKEVSEVVSKINSISDLEKIIEIDGRKGVVDACENRIDEINAAIEAQKDNEEKDEE